MRQFSLTLSGKTIRSFSSPCQALIYLVDILIKGSLLILFGFAGLFHEVFITSSDQLSVYLGIYIFAIWIWGLLLIKYVLSKGKVVGKTRFDIFLIGILFFSLVSVLLSAYRSRGVFGSSGTWSINILTYMSISLIFYAAYATFNYVRGLKWLAFAVILSIVVPGIRFMYFILDDNPVRHVEYLNYVVLNIPLMISFMFLFKRFLLKMFSLVGLLISLFLVSYNADYLQDGMFFLGIGVLALFILFYFAFWVRNLPLIQKLLVSIREARFRLGKIVSIFKEDLRFRTILLIVGFVALWIIVFASFLLGYYNENFSHFGDWLQKDLGLMDGLRMWIFGKNNLSLNQASFETSIVLINYGLVLFLFLTIFLGYLVYILGGLTIRFLYKASWRNIVFASSLFISIVTISSFYLMDRLTPFLQLELISVVVFTAIIGALLRKESTYKVGECRSTGILSKTVVKIVAISLILAVTLFMMNGMMRGLDEGLFVVSG